MHPSLENPLFPQKLYFIFITIITVPFLSQNRHGFYRRGLVQNFYTNMGNLDWIIVPYDLRIEIFIVRKHGKCCVNFVSTGHSNCCLSATTRLIFSARFQLETQKFKKQFQMQHQEIEACIRKLTVRETQSVRKTLNCLDVQIQSSQ